ncbi:MAG: hypothetical protein HON78_05190 [Legionellales bacterium]|jgi:hypothetical protein|nr:hypothetical protein [Legionellales bacterium]
MGLSLKDLQHITKCNNTVVEKILAKIKSIDDPAKKEVFVQQAMHLIGAWSCHYSSDVLERYFLGIASQYSSPKPLPDFVKDTVLHVMTETYKTGGHTRVVERWVKADGVSRRQSLLLTSCESRDIPSVLQSVIESSGGSIYQLRDTASDLGKGLELRQIAAKYEYVVLHQHDHDVIPIIAFGNMEFKSPVFLFNHADFRFTVGFSVTDKVLTLSSWSAALANNYRGINKTCHIPLLNDSKIKTLSNDMLAVRKELGLPLNKKIIVTAASSQKYKALGSTSLLNVANKIFAQIPNVIMIVIGAKSKTFPQYKKVLGSNNVNFVLLDLMPPLELYKYFIAANLIIDSIPLGGGAAMIDAMHCNRPILSLKNIVGQLDYLVHSEAYCDTEEIFIRKVTKILSSKNEALANIKNVKDCYAKYEYASNEDWLAKLDLIYNSVAAHKIVEFKTPTATTVSNLDLLHCNNSLKTMFSLKLLNIFSVSLYKNIFGKYIKVVMLTKYSRLLVINRKVKSVCNKKYGVPFLLEFVKNKDIFLSKKSMGFIFFGIKIFSYERNCSKRACKLFGIPVYSK